MKLTLFLLLGLSLCTFKLAIAVHNADPIAEALKLRTQTEEVPSPFFSANAWWSSRPDETYSLETNPVFNQGSTQFCWAYAGLHALRTYYSHTPEANMSWKAFLEGFKATTDYKNYVLKQVGSTSIGGWPIEIILFYTKSIGVEAPEKWTSYSPSSELSGWSDHVPPDLHPYTPQSYFVPMAEIIEKIHEGLKEGIPTPYCNVTHCVSIFGGTYKDGVPTQYKIADSAGGYTYSATPSKVHKVIADIVAPFK